MIVKKDALRNILRNIDKQYHKELEQFIDTFKSLIHTNARQNQKWLNLFPNCAV